MSNNKNAETLELHRIGDQELWYAEAQDSSWRLPLLIEWRHDRKNDKHYALIDPAVSLYTNQALTMQALFQHHDISEGKGRWLIPRGIAEAILHKAPGITPAYYYSWPEDNCPPLPPTWKISMFGAKTKDPAASIDAQPFIKHVAGTSGIPSSIVSIVWKAACTEAPAWMMENKASLDMGFCQLVAFPWRPNWKQIVTFKLRGIKLNRLFSLEDAELRPALESIDMPATLCSTHNVSIAHQSHINYTLEAIPTKRFNDEMRRIESKRLACGWSSYMAHYEESVEKLYNHAIRALGSYVKKVSTPFAKVSNIGVAGVLRFRAVGAKQVKILGVAADDMPVHIIPPDSRFSVLSGESDPRLVQAQIAQVPEVSALAQRTDDLRECSEQGNLVGEGHPEPDGLPVQYVVEGKVQWKPMLPGDSPYDRDAPRLDQ